MKLTFLSASVGIMLLTGAAHAQPLRGEALLKALRQGGYIIAMRHTSSPREVPDKQTANADNLKPERQLDQEGRSTATAMGKALRDLKIPIGEVLTSPTYRALETVKFAQFGKPQPYAELGDNGQSMQGGTAAQAAWLQKRVTQFPSGTNTIIVTHLPNMTGAFPQLASGLADGEALIFASDGKGGAALAARIRIEEWSAMDQAMIQTDHAFVQALATGDKNALEQLLDADFTWTGVDGKTRSKTQVAQDLPKPAITNENDAQLQTYTYGEIGDVQSNLGRAHVLRVWVKRPAGWKAIVYQEVLSLDAPPSSTPGAGKDCENPCKTISYKPKNETEQQVVTAYSKLETAAMAHNSAVFATLVGDEFVAASSNSDKLHDKRGRMEDFDHSRMSGVAPTPLMSARMFDFNDAVLMTSDHQPDRGKPLHVTRLWVKRNGSWVETLSYQTSVNAATPK